MHGIIENASQRKDRIERNVIGLKSPVPRECESYGTVEKKTRKRRKASWTIERVAAGDCPIIYGSCAFLPIEYSATPTLI
ncbi:hypothetical protein AVEN_150225-1 [Araneus ventricosus]|uniref:Uncharacterized protein n=1 Tax=Araneus ventricosus TaxID=182803 RepID=A0A4Y2G493_ARAVE|nr:hypothetical protein AVEN_150225-1 [Araneus ventricosus]